MNRTEIKVNKKIYLIIISIFTCCSVFAIWGITLPDVELFYKFGLAVFVLLWLYQSYKWIKVINDPLVILTKTSIQIRDKNKDNFFLWSDIVDYKVDLNDIVGYSLTILTKTDSQTFVINGLEKLPDQLRKTIDDFRS
jgi:hypothetical protein